MDGAVDLRYGCARDDNSRCHGGQGDKIPTSGRNRISEIIKSTSSSPPPTPLPYPIPPPENLSHPNHHPDPAYVVEDAER